MSWDGYTHENPLENIEALPQGDPFGPLALNTYMAADTKGRREDLRRWRSSELDEYNNKKRPLEEEEDCEAQDLHGR